MRNLRVNKAIIGKILFGTVCVGSMTGYYTYENQQQIVKNDIDESLVYTNEDGVQCYYFDVGEHKICISRNDSFHRKIEAIDGYEIEEVEVNSWCDNNKVTYVNSSPVVVIATKYADGSLTFDNFGTIVNDKKENLTKSLSND